MKKLELHVVVAIVHGRLAVGVVEIEGRRGRLDRLAGQIGRDAGYLRFEIHLRAVLGQEAHRPVRVNAHARIAQQIIRLGDDALDSPLR